MLPKDHTARCPRPLVGKYSAYNTGVLALGHNFLSVDMIFKKERERNCTLSWVVKIRSGSRV